MISVFDGRHVAVHATTPEGMRRAVAGVDTIKHGWAGTDANSAKMARRGIAYLPTLTAEKAYADDFSTTRAVSRRRRKRRVQPLPFAAH